MDLIEAIKQRRSIRAYKATPVPKQAIEEIISLARLSPSATNYQPWEFIVLTGKSLETAKRVNVEQMEAEAPITPDFKALPPNQLASPYGDRQAALARTLFDTMGIERHDKSARYAWQVKGKRFFDAPAAIWIAADETIFNEQHQISLVDLGIATQTIALAALEFDLGTCIQQDTIFYPGALRKALDIPASKLLIVSIAIGYPDWDAPANQFRSEREVIEAMVSWKV